MNRKIFRLTAFGSLLSAFLSTSCAVSRTHLGFHNLEEEGLWHSIVGKKHVKGLRDQEDRWMSRFAALDLDGLSTAFAPKLADELSETHRAKLVQRLTLDYRPDGYFTRRRFETPAFSFGQPTRNDPFQTYDMLGCAYRMEGKVEADVEFYFVRLDGKLKICGFVVSPVKESDREKAKVVRLVFPESARKSTLVPRPGSLMKRVNSEL